MTNITITLTSTEHKAMETIAFSPQEWAENAVFNMVRIIQDDIVSKYTARALDEGVQIPATRELIVADAFTRGWAQTAAEIHAAQTAAEASEEETPSE